METKEHLTNEYLRKKFKSQFELVKYAIKRASYIIRSGRESHSHSDENPALTVLEDIENEDVPKEISFEELKSKNKIHGSLENGVQEKIEKIQKKSAGKKKTEFTHKEK